MTESLTLNLSEILVEKFPRGFHAPADIDIDTFLEFADDDWSHEIDLEQLLAEKQMIGVCWSVQLVLDERPDLTEEQAWAVLQACQPQFADVTETMRQSVRDTATHLFPVPQGKDALRAYLNRIERQIDALPQSELTDPAGFGRIAIILDTLQAALKGDAE